MSEKKILTKQFSREHSLFYIKTWAYSGSLWYEKFLGESVKSILYFFDPDDAQVTSWYDTKEIARLCEFVVKKSQEDKNFFDWIEIEFKKSWGKIEPYVRGRKKVKTVEELKLFYKDVISFYGPNMVVYITPWAENVASEYKDITLRLRESVQEYVNDIDDVFLKFFSNKFPEYAEMTNFILPEEVFDLKDAPLSDEKISEIKLRQENGYLIFNNKLASFGELQKVLDKNNIVLEDYKNYYKQFTKEHSREYSLFRVRAWYTSMTEGMSRIVGEGVVEACAVYEGEDLVSVYYEPDELRRIFGLILKKCSDKEFIKKEIDYYLETFQKLKQYFSGKLKVDSIEELREFYELYSSMFCYMAVIFVIPSFSVDEELKELAYKARVQTQEYNETPEKIIEEKLEEFFPHLKGKTRFVLPSEVWDGEVENKEEILNKIEERKKGFVYYKNKLYTGDVQGNLKKLKIELIDTKSVVSGEVNQEKENEIKGQIARKGVVRGRVKLVSSIEHLEKVEEGDILVASMTMPKYLPAMKRAAAFVTDEGGITCHAAIIAREMDKPCIIGTKIATRVLKDGMEVEVDADRGVVKILKK